VVIPYAGASTKKLNFLHVLAGPRYAILSTDYALQGERILRKKANRLLISCGGSDPKNLTLRILKGIKRVTERLDIRVICGPLFNSKLIGELRDLVKLSSHQIEVVNAPSTLVEHMIWCDVAIAASGLIKYELAATATPSILVSIDKSHDIINQAFTLIGSTVDLGCEFDSQTIAESLAMLLGNYDLRLAMSTAGRAAVDGHGAGRVVDDIYRSI
jgi:UDP-2,4-diacetamido-2,4,6-trideoxy-beta-L-altropyranose hydrolase